jgi:hypothetical protein
LVPITGERAVLIGLAFGYYSNLTKTEVPSPKGSEIVAHLANLQF